MNTDAPRTKKKIAIGLQGGGSHGAYTWGVLDALLEDDRLEIEGVSGTSAGGMCATAVAHGLIKGGNAGARETLRYFWELIGEKGKTSPFQFNPFQKKVRDFSIGSNPAFMMLKSMMGLLSPYQFNPTGVNPMGDLIDKVFDFDALQKGNDIVKLFLCATHVATGKLRIFNGETLTKEAVLASACIPSLFHAVKIEDDFYWDGGYIGNPALYPLIYGCETSDLLVIQLRRVYSPKLPTSVHDIANRLSEITQNACLTREMRSISFVTKLIDDGIVQPNALKRLHIHMIRDDAFMGGLDAGSGFFADMEFIQYLYEAGRRAGKEWLKNHFADVGVKTSAEIAQDFVS
jgi:NTE family protein